MLVRMKEKNQPQRCREYWMMDVFCVNQRYSSKRIRRISMPVKLLKCGSREQSQRAGLATEEKQDEISAKLKRNISVE